MHSKSFNLNIVPCIDSLLYAPIYLAIIAMCRRGNLQGQVTNPNSQILINNYGENKNNARIKIDKLIITYEDKASGDLNTVKRLINKDPESIVIGICDPKTVVESNLSNRQKSLKDKHHIISVFIDKISLSLLTRIPKDNYTGINNGKDLESRDRALNNIINKLKSDGINSINVLRENSRIIKYEYWSDGNTTKFLANHYLHLENSTNYSGIAEYNENSESNFDLLRLIKKFELDIIVSHAPWEFDAKQKDELKIFSRECFPSIQYPFSCIATPYLSGDNIYFNSILSDFIEYIYLSIMLINREPHLAITLLFLYKNKFRNYGINDDAVVCERISSAINHFLITGCYSNGFWPEWAAWQYAIGLDNNLLTKYGGNNSYQWSEKINTALFDTINMNLSNSILQDIDNNWESFLHEYTLLASL